MNKDEQDEPDEIQVRYENGEEYPAIDIRTRGLRKITGEDVQKAFPLYSEVLAEESALLLFEKASKKFWNDDLPELCFFHFRNHALKVKAVRAKRVGFEGGWLIVEGLKPVAEWSHSDKRTWYHFRRAIYREMRYTDDVQRMLLDAYEEGISYPKKG